MKMYVFIINSIAGNGKGLRVWKQVKEELDRKKVRYRSFFTKHSGHAEEIAQQIAELHQDKLEAVIAVGGDGTVHEVMNGLVSYPRLPVGYIAAGSGNDFARGFAVPKSPIKALHKILNQRGFLRIYDLGTYRLSSKKRKERFFTNGIGIGFDGEVAKLTNESKYKPILSRMKLGVVAYVISVFRHLFHYQPRGVTIRIDHQELYFPNVWLVAVSNIPYYGGGMKISPSAKPNDGKLNVCVVNNLHRWKLFAIFGTVFVGQHIRFKEVTLLEGKEIEVKSDEPMTIHADGEIIGHSPIFISIEEKYRPII